MSLVRYEQIYRYFHVCDVEDLQTSLDQNSTTQKRKLKAHEKVEPIAKRLQSNFRKYWAPGTDIAVDECIAGFSGRCSDTVNIPTKPTPNGFKLWVLSDSGYVLDFLFHVRTGPTKKDSQGPQGLRKEWSSLEIPPTQQVVIELMSKLDGEGAGHCVWLDNLFTSEKLLTALRNRGIGGAGTVRLGQTQSEEDYDKKGKGACNEPKELGGETQTDIHDVSNISFSQAETQVEEIPS